MRINTWFQEEAVVLSVREQMGNDDLNGVVTRDVGIQTESKGQGIKSEQLESIITRRNTQLKDLKKKLISTKNELYAEKKKEEDGGMKDH